MDKLCETINRQCCLHCEMECDGKWLETEIEMYKEDLLKKQADKIANLEAKLAEKEKRDLKLLYEKNKTIIELEEELKYSKNDYMLLEEQLENANDWNKGLLEEIDQLKQQLIEECKEHQEFCKVADEKVKELKQQLAEKDELLKQKIGKMKSTDFIKMCVECGFMVQAKKVDNQTAIETLEKVKDKTDALMFKINNMNYFIMVKEELYDFIDKQIKLLKGDK